jgi:hypothetical protein
MGGSMNPTAYPETMIGYFLDCVNERQDPDEKIDREWVIGYDEFRFRLPGWIGEAYQVIGLYVRVTDELNYFYLLGIYHGDTLEVLLSCVDTMWRLERNVT